MNEEYVKELLDKADKSAFLIGLTYGALSVLIERFKFGKMDFDSLLSELLDLKEIMRTNIDSLYYEKKEPEKNPIDEFLDKNVNALGFSHRTELCLLAENINTLRDLIEKTENQLLRTPNLGKKSLAEIKEALSKIGLKLKDEDA